MAAATACAATAKYTHTADEKFPARASNCKLKVTSTLPKDAAWQEIGVVNVQLTRRGMSGPETPDEFLALIHDDVCAAGGEHIVAEVNGMGLYIRGTVFRRGG